MTNMHVLGLDPGPNATGFVQMFGAQPISHGHMPNDEMRAWLRSPSSTQHEGCLLAVESVEHYGMPVGRDVFETVFWSGRFVECWAGSWVRIPRSTVKLTLCGSKRADDGTVRQALIDRFGGDEAAIGGKKCPTCHGKGQRGRGAARAPCGDCKGQGGAPKGPLYGISGHAWAALGVAIVAGME